MHGEAASSLITVSRAEPDNKEERETFQEQGVFFGQAYAKIQSSPQNWHWRMHTS